MSDTLINGLAGAGGGIIAQLLTYPLQTVTILFFFVLTANFCVIFLVDDNLRLCLLKLGKYAATDGA